MYIRNKWVNGVLVNIIPWIDGQSIYLHMSEWKSGSSIERRPDWEKSVLIPLKYEDTLRNNLHSVIHHYRWEEAE